MSEEYLNGLPAIENLSDVERVSLPSWIKSNLATARIIGNASRTIELQDGRRYSLANAINDLGVQIGQSIFALLLIRIIQQREQIVTLMI